MGFLSGFDRVVFRGTLRPLSVTSGMMNFLYHTGVLLKDFGSFRRDLALDSEVDASGIDASCKNGVLTILLTISERAKAIKVKGQ
jgi:hypothetical protein